MPTLASDQVHVWGASVAAAAARVRALENTLSDDERRRASRFYSWRDRLRFTVARGVLRAVLGGYLDAKPACLSFRYTKHGQPLLDALWAETSLTFSVSHSCDLVLCAVSAGRRVGVDVECLHPRTGLQEVLHAYFTPAERARLGALPPQLRHEAILTSWTRKEAYTKAKGLGMTVPFDSLEVSVAWDGPPRLLSTALEPQDASRWSLRQLLPAPRYVATVAAEGVGWDTQCWAYTEN